MFSSSAYKIEDKKIWYKILDICDREASKALKLEIYKGKETNEKRASNLGGKVVLDFSKAYVKNDRNITCDNFYTCLEWGREQLQRKLTLFGAVRKNRTELPTHFTNNGGCHVSTTWYGFEDDDHNHPKKNKIATLLSTMHKNKSNLSTTQNKPEIIQCFNSTKRGCWCSIYSRPNDTLL